MLEQMEQLAPSIFRTPRTEWAIMPEATKPHPEMSDYEATAWASLIEQVGRRQQRKQFKPIKKAEEIAAASFERIEKLLDDHEQLRQITDELGKPFGALQDLVTRASAASVSSRRILRRAARAETSITSLDDLRRLTSPSRTGCYVRTRWSTAMEWPPKERPHR